VCCRVWQHVAGSYCCIGVSALHDRIVAICFVPELQKKKSHSYMGTSESDDEQLSVDVVDVW